MDRRRFLKLGAAATPAMLAMSRLSAWAQQKDFDPQRGNWRNFEITTRVEVLNARDATRVWLPMPVGGLEDQEVFETRSGGNAERWSGGGGSPVFGANALYAHFRDGEPAPRLEATTRFRTRDRSVDWSHPARPRTAPAELALWKAAAHLRPPEPIVAEMSRQITDGSSADVDKVRAIYDWIVTNTHREPTVRGCGTGDVRRMLETKNFGGKCADINGLFVALVQAGNVPARDVYGIRVAPSAFGYRSLGAASETITKAQHCRAEVYLEDYGWVAMDPADVAKVAREETSEPLPLDDARVGAVRAKLFGGWEGNWVAFNVAHDVVLPHAADQTPLPFFMYPQCETAGERRDPLDADNFRYTITVREVDGA